jgi:hypothetical protein
VVRKLVSLALEKHKGCFIRSLTHKESVMCGWCAKTGA